MPDEELEAAYEDAPPTLSAVGLGAEGGADDASVPGRETRTVVEPVREVEMVELLVPEVDER